MDQPEDEALDAKDTPETPPLKDALNPPGSHSFLNECERRRTRGIMWQTINRKPRGGRRS